MPYLSTLLESTQLELKKLLMLNQWQFNWWFIADWFTSQLQSDPSVAKDNQDKKNDDEVLHHANNNQNKKNENEESDDEEYYDVREDPQEKGLNYMILMSNQIDILNMQNNNLKDKNQRLTNENDNLSKRLKAVKQDAALENVINKFEKIHHNISLSNPFMRNHLSYVKRNILKKLIDKIKENKLTENNGNILVSIDEFLNQNIDQADTELKLKEDIKKNGAELTYKDVLSLHRNSFFALERKGVRTATEKAIEDLKLKYSPTA